MDLKDFDYSLPEELIAQFPARRRDRSRLLVYDRNTGDRHHLRFGDIVSYFRKGDALVVNNTRVFKARLIGHRRTGARVEILLVRVFEEGSGELWIGLARPSRRIKVGEQILFDKKDSLTLEKDIGGGRWLVRFRSASSRKRVISHFGHVPLPPYISRKDEPGDVRRYQTVFADPVGSIAAPTAGFHFTRPLLKKLRQKGVAIVEVTLHVGPGTFKPIQSRDIRQHSVDPEYAVLTPVAARRLSRIRQRGGAIFAVGSTSMRTLESTKVKGGQIQPFEGMTNLYIRPGHRFRLVSHLITNFHLPKSSLLVLVSSFAGRDEIMSLYREAIDWEYRFYSYGDAMLIL
ncbi:MAG: tRNA preQ1(34) S-adenosylmethionine ribosyltransferase-isomerase QueA [Candidatus Zixiibacteriota bacterium]|nr:MAG: tRNA preQ1(34) S-adenosylmethionine ribosyltransferase-isomerase QueA [candidate division Zixibacteria bacterium]